MFLALVFQKLLERLNRRRQVQTGTYEAGYLDAKAQRFPQSNDPEYMRGWIDGRAISDRDEDD